MSPRRLALALALAPAVAVAPGAAARADSTTTRERSVQKLADGVYEIRHPDAPDEFPQSNTLVVIGARSVLVVDSCYLPSDAKKDIAQIRQWTKLPVRYLVNTHWHYDHTNGNGAYAEAFPGLTIVAQLETKKQSEGYDPGWVARFPGRTAELERLLADGKDTDGTALSPERRAEMTRVIAGRARVAPEIRALAIRTPDVGFGDELDLDLGGRQVALRHLGRGNTAGDAIVWLPRERIVAVGDLLDYPVPYLGGGYPLDLVATLGRVAELDFATLVPGHGEILPAERARAHLALVREFVGLVAGEVSKEIYRVGNGPRNLDAVRAGVMKTLDVAGWRQRFAGDDPDSRELFDTFSLPGVITASYAQQWGR